MAAPVAATSPSGTPPRFDSHPEQRELLHAFENGSFLGLLHRITRSDNRHCPAVHESRIADRNNPMWKRDGAFLLIQRKQETIKAMLDNSLPYRCKRDMHTAVRIISTRTGPSKPDPTVYVNWLTKSTGDGWTVDEYKLFLDKMEEYAGDSCPKELDDKIEAMYKSRKLKNVKGTFKETIDRKQLKTHVTTFVQINRDEVLREAVKMNVEQMFPRPEAGWPNDTPLRAHQHKLISKRSLPAFWLARCIIGAMFPNQGVKMMQFVLFDVMREEEAAIGESIAARLVAGYAHYGGFNFETTGIQCKVFANEKVDWRVQAKRAQDNGYSFHVKASLKLWKDHEDQEAAAIKVKSFGDSL